MEVAGLAAMLVAKAHEISDRLKENSTDRLSDKDAADVYRILQIVSVEEEEDASCPRWVCRLRLG